MKLFYLSVMAVGALALPSLPDAFSQIPSCSYSALASAMDQEGCSTSSVSTSSLDCLCSSLYNIGYDVGYSQSLDPDCLSDFVQTLGTACGIYLADESSSDVPDAVQVLASEVGGSAGATDSPSATTSSHGIVQVTATGPSPTATTSSHSLIQVTATGPSPTATTKGPNPLVAGEPSSSNIAGPQVTMGMLAPFAAVGLFLL